jgi:hypothetical protein
VTNNVCYCEGPWQDRALPKWMTDRAHVPGPDCKRADQPKPVWLRKRAERIAEARRRFGTERIADKALDQ